MNPRVILTEIGIAVENRKSDTDGTNARIGLALQTKTDII